MNVCLCVLNEFYTYRRVDLNCDRPNSFNLLYVSMCVLWQPLQYMDKIVLLCYIPISVQWMIILWWYHLFMWFKFWLKFRFKNQIIKIKYILIFFVVTTLNCLWCSFSQQSNPTDECEKRQTKCEWYFDHMNEGSMSELSWSPVVCRL